MRRSCAAAVLGWICLSLSASASTAENELLFPWAAARAASELQPGASSSRKKHGKLLRWQKTHVSLLQTHGADAHKESLGSAGEPLATSGGKDDEEDLAAKHEHYRLAADVDSLRDRLESVNGNQAELQAKVKAQSAALQALHRRAAINGHSAKEAERLAQTLVFYLKALGATAVSLGVACGAYATARQAPRPCCPRRQGDGTLQKAGLSASKSAFCTGKDKESEVSSSVASTPLMPQRDPQASLADWARLVAAAAAKQEVVGFGVDTRRREQAAAALEVRTQPSLAEEKARCVVDTSKREQAAARQAQSSPKLPEFIGSSDTAALPIAEPHRPSNTQRVRSVAPPEPITDPAPAPKPPPRSAPPQPGASPTPSPMLPRCRAPTTPPPSSVSPQDRKVSTPPVQGDSEKVVEAPADLVEPLPKANALLARSTSRVRFADDASLETAHECEYFSLERGKRIQPERCATSDENLKVAEAKWWGVKDETKPSEWSV